MIKAEYAHEVFRKDIHMPKDLLEQKKFAELEDFFSQLWLSRNKNNPQQWENDWFDQPYHMLKDLFLNQGPLVLKRLDEWSLSFPESFFPYIVRVRYWAFWASEYRGGGWSSDVTEDMWDCAREAQKQIFASVLQAFTFSSETWTVAIHLLNTTVQLDEPNWFDDWLLQQTQPSLRHKIKPSAKELANKSGLHDALPIDIPDQVPELLTKYKHLKNKIDLPQPNAAFWLKIFFEESGFGLVAAIDYCWYLLPRWGHRHEDIMNFVQSDWCQHFSEIEKSELKYLVWFDSVDQYMESDQTIEIKKMIQKAQDILKRPLSEEHRAVIYLKLAYFYYLLDEKNPRILTCYQQAADFAVFDEYELDRAIQFWKMYVPNEDFLGRIALSNRKTLASAAVLFGFLCQHGWSGVEQNKLVSYSWYEHAKSLEAPQAYPKGRFCCFYRVANNFDDEQGYPYTIDLLHKGADLGFIYCCFSAGYIHSLTDHPLYDTDKELYYAKKAADQGHFIAVYNMGIHYLNLAMDENEVNPEVYLKQSFQYFEQTRTGLEKSQKEGSYSNQEILDDIVDIYVKRLFNYSYYSDIANKIIPILKEKGQQRHIPSMCALAKLFIDQENRPEYFSYKEAVKWSQAAHLQDPDHEQVNDALSAVMGRSKRSRKLYDQVFMEIRPDEFPGRQDILI